MGHLLHVRVGLREVESGDVILDCCTLDVDETSGHIKILYEYVVMAASRPVNHDTDNDTFLRGVAS